MSVADRVAEITLLVGRMLRDSPFPNRIIRWHMKDGTYVEARKIQHKLQKVYWSKVEDADSWQQTPPPPRAAAG